ncbi:MAG: hypothetical protein WBC92_02995 [Terracidiphilus sp.]
MNRRLIANLIGWLGIACSLAFWVWDAICVNLPFHLRGTWMRLDLGVSNVWPALWLAGLLLFLVAAVLGSKRWVFATIVPIASCAAAIIYSSRAHL